jgi:hypothetical protein
MTIRDYNWGWLACVIGGAAMAYLVDRWLIARNERRQRRGK